MPDRPVSVPLPNLAVVQRPLSALTPDPRNARRHSPDQIKALARSIEAVGFNVPVLVDRDLKVLAGHCRLLAAKELGLSEIPTISLEHLSDAQARAFAIADNRLGELSIWDDQILAEHLKELSEITIDFDIEAIGFEMPEIDIRIASLEEAPEEDADPADEIPEPGPAVTRPGDLWQLGRHRILCASALDEGSYTQLLGGERAAMVFTDPPYNVPIEGHVSGNGVTRHREFAMASGEMSRAEFVTFLTTTCQLLASHSEPGSLHYLAMDWRHMGELLSAGEAVFAELKNLCVWTKTNGGMGSLYRSQHELIFVFKNAGKTSHRNNVQLGKYGRNRSNVWNYSGANSSAGEKGKRLLHLHPTVKPVALVTDAILDCTARGDIVLDAFLGSGTTLLAAQRSGRVCRALEIDPLYVDTAIRRWQQHTGAEAIHASGHTFDEVEADRGQTNAA